MELWKQEFDLALSDDEKEIEKIYEEMIADGTLYETLEEMGFKVKRVGGKK